MGCSSDVVLAGCGRVLLVVVVVTQSASSQFPDIHCRVLDLPGQRSCVRWLSPWRFPAGEGMWQLSPGLVVSPDTTRPISAHHFLQRSMWRPSPSYLLSIPSTCLILGRVGQDDLQGALPTPTSSVVSLGENHWLCFSIAQCGQQRAGLLCSGYGDLHQPWSHC